MSGTDDFVAGAAASAVPSIVSWRRMTAVGNGAALLRRSLGSQLLGRDIDRRLQGSYVVVAEREAAGRGSGNMRPKCENSGRADHEDRFAQLRHS